MEGIPRVAGSNRDAGAGGFSGGDGVRKGRELGAFQIDDGGPFLSARPVALSFFTQTNACIHTRFFFRMDAPAFTCTNTGRGSSTFTKGRRGVMSRVGSIPASSLSGMIWGGRGWHVILRAGRYTAAEGAIVAKKKKNSRRLDTLL